MLCELDVTLPPSINDPDVSFIIHAVSFIGESILNYNGQYFYRNVQFSKASLDGVLFL